uniref:Uncharacterized protein n=1 Tax=Meloidogyne floridensis TaxID=298350 RepID=A0A915PG00_9BILA
MQTTKISMSSLAAVLILICSLFALNFVKGEQNNDQKANLANEDLEQLLEKRFAPRQFAFAKRGMRNFAFAKRSFGDYPFGSRTFAFAKRAAENFEENNDINSSSQFGGENSFARFAFAKKSLRNFAFAR